MMSISCQRSVVGLSGGGQAVHVVLPGLCVVPGVECCPAGQLVLLTEQPSAASD
jgi:hypothetical protein